MKHDAFEKFCRGGFCSDWRTSGKFNLSLSAIGEFFLFVESQSLQYFALCAGFSEKALRPDNQVSQH